VVLRVLFADIDLSWPTLERAFNEQSPGPVRSLARLKNKHRALIDSQKKHGPSTVYGTIDEVEDMGSESGDPSSKPPRKRYKAGFTDEEKQLLVRLANKKDNRQGHGKRNRE
jgi:hypothetical protein